MPDKNAEASAEHVERRRWEIFAFFFLTDPPTSPNRYRDQMVCAAIVAASGYLIFERLGAAHYLLSGVLVGNVWETWRRAHARRTVHGAPRTDRAI